MQIFPSAIGVFWVAFWRKRLWEDMKPAGANIPVIINNDINDHTVALHKVVRIYENGKLTSAKIYGMNPNGGTGYKFSNRDIKNSRPYAIFKRF